MDGPTLLTPYAEANRAICRTHGLILEAIKIDLDRRNRVDISPVQALILHNIGERVFKAAEIERIFGYLAPNLSEVVEELFEKGFFENRRGYAFRDGPPSLAKEKRFATLSKPSIKNTLKPSRNITFLRRI